jgi:hypothetical protein
VVVHGRDFDAVLDQFGHDRIDLCPYRKPKSAGKRARIG